MDELRKTVLAKTLRESLGGSLSSSWESPPAPAGSLCGWGRERDAGRGRIGHVESARLGGNHEDWLLPLGD